jgi:hypothetical protein
MPLNQEQQRGVETIRKAILIRTGFLSEYGKNVEVKLYDYSMYSQDDEGVSELVFSVRISGIDVYDAGFETEVLTREIDNMKNKIYGACNFGLEASTLKIRKGNDCRGVTLDSLDYSLDTINELQLSVFFDPESNF